MITMSPAFYETYGRRLASWIEFTGIRLERGDADLGAFRAGVERIAAGAPVGIFPKETISLEARAIDPCAGAGAMGARGARWPHGVAPGRAGAGAPDQPWSPATTRSCGRSG